MLLDIFNMKMDYDDAFEFYCFENCLKHILDYLGVKNSMLYMDATLNLVFTEVGDDKHDYRLRVNTNRSNLLPQFQSKAHIYKNESLDAEYVWKQNKERIDEGIPILTGVDVFHLSYQSSYNKIHGAHGVILCGYSEDESQVNIVDWYKPWFYRGTVEIKEYLLARSSKNLFDGNIFSGITIGNAWVELDREGWDSREDKLLDIFINNTIERYYRNDSIDRGNIPEGEKIISHGIHALKDVLRLILEYKDADIGIRKDFLSMLHKNIYRVSRRKKLFKYYLQSVLQIYKLEAINDVIKSIDTIIEKWERMILTILKASMLNTDKHYDLVISSMKEVIGYEEGLYDCLVTMKEALELC